MTPNTMLDQVGNNTSSAASDEMTLGKVIAFIAAGAFIVYGLPWLLSAVAGA